MITGEGMLSEMNAIQQAVIIGMYNVIVLVPVQVRQVRIFVSSINKNKDLL